MVKILHFYKFCLLSCLCWFSSASVWAAEGNLGTVGRASAGTVVVAAMESVGYHSQTKILTSLNTMLGDLGGLIYLGVLVSALITVALMGRYQAVLWILIGPSLFIYVSGVELGGLKNRVTARGPEWKLGAFNGSDEQKERVMRRQDSPTEVSMVFHKYNELISEVYQLLISKITAEDAKKSILFMARQRIVEDLYSFDLTSATGKNLGVFFFANCSKYFSFAKTLAKGSRDPAYRDTGAYQTAKDEYCEGFPRKEIILSNNIPLADDLKKMDPPLGDDLNTSCLQLWNWFKQSAAKDVASQGEAMYNTVFGIDATLSIGGGVAALATQNVVDKIVKNDETGVDPCPFPSDATKQALQDNGITSESFKVLTNIFTALLIRKNNTIDANSTSFRAILGGDLAFVTPSSDSSSSRDLPRLQGRDSILRAQNAKTMAVARQFEAFSLLMLVPYFQGMILYALSVSYPFFALTILVPGQAGSFFNWLALWAWAKSWDVGFAMVMVVDQLLWEILPQTTFFSSDSLDSYTPIDLLEMHYSGDYAYAISMYWLIVSALIGAVPVVTAEAILGSKKAVAGAIMGGLSDIGGRMGKAVESYHATGNVADLVRARAQGETFALRANTSKAGDALDRMNKNMPTSELGDSYRHNMNQFNTTLGILTGTGEDGAAKKSMDEVGAAAAEDPVNRGESNPVPPE